MVVALEDWDWGGAVADGSEGEDVGEEDGEEKDVNGWVARGSN